MADIATLGRRASVLSGRIQPTGWVAPEGSWVYCLGIDEPGWTGRFNDGDSIRISQLGGYGSANLFRTRARARGPLAALPNGWSWQAYASIDAVEIWSVDLNVGETRDLFDLAGGLADFTSGGSTFEFGLRVIGTGDPGVELEIPAFYFDSLVLDETTDLVVANRTPSEGETGVSQLVASGFVSHLGFDLICSSPPDPDSIWIWVDGVPVLTDVGSAPGYGVLGTTPTSDSFRIRISVPYIFDSLRVVPIRVIAASLDGLHTIDTTWSFTIEDLTGPVLLSASSTSERVVRLTFDEPIAGGTVPGAYVFTQLEAPSVPVVAVSVEEVAPTIFDVTLNTEITRGLLYRVVATVEDLFGNSDISPYDRAEFRGWVCDSPADREFTVWDNMIPKIARDRDVTRDLFKFASVVQEPIDLLLCDVDRWTDILDVDVAAERFVDQMLIGLGNPFDFALTLEEKRRLTLSLVPLYQKKGTDPGIVDTVRFFLGIEVTVRAYLEGGWILGDSELGIDTILGPGTRRQRFTFEVVSAIVLTDEQRTSIRKIVDYMKPGHTHLARIVEPTPVISVDHLELGLSELGGDEWMLH